MGHIENWGTFWGHDRTTLGRRWGKKIPLPLPPQKEKNWTIQECVIIFLLISLPYSISAPAISGGQKWSPTVLETKKTSDQWVG